MDTDLKKDKIKKNKNLKNKIIREYLYIIFTILFLYFLLPFLASYMIGDNTGIDGIGQTLGVAIPLMIFKYIITFIFFVINPIRILIIYKNEFKAIFPKIKKVICILVTILPIFISSLIILEIPISNFTYKLKYKTGKNAYTVRSENYKLPIDFYNELKERNLLYDEDTYSLMTRLNDDHDCINYIHDDGNLISQKCYAKATMMGINDARYYDSIDKSNITDMYQNSFPVYMYNSILTLPSKNEKMQYAALGRFSYNVDDYGDYRAEFKDYYIECKILYVDGDIYAIIGLGQSYDVEKYNNEVGDALFSYNYPFNMILSEKNSITTFVDGKYYPNGAIENSGSIYEMKPNNNFRYTSHYPVRKVDRLDIDTINDIAEELQNGVLKNSIEYHFDK